jgi:YidC/Oxa1 family membrane protein insertase
VERRLLLALVLCLLLTFVWVQLFAPRQARQTPAAPSTATQPAPAAQGPPSAAPETKPAEEAPRPAQSFESREISWRSGPFLARFTTVGARLLDLRVEGIYERVGLTDAERADPQNWLLLLKPTRDGGGSFGLRDHTGALEGADLERYVWEGRVVPGDGGGDGSVHFRLPLVNGLTFEKEIRAGSGGYGLEVVLRLRNENPDLVGKDYVFSFAPADSIRRDADPYYPDPVALAAYRGRFSVGLETIPPGKLKDGYAQDFPKPSGEDLAWAGAESKYFAVLARPLPPTRVAFARAVPETHPSAPKTEEELPPGVRVELGLQFHTPAVGAVEEKTFSLYLGPKETKVLQAADESFGELLDDDYGWFGWMSRILLWILRLFHGITDSWGVAIVLLTAVVRGTLFPINLRQQRSMAAFQVKVRKIQPQIDEIRKKYKDDFRKQQHAMGKLYQEHGLRPPLAGCLTIFLQFPVFLGLFYGLRAAYELRHAPFLWIGDLSLPDHTLHFGTKLPLLGWETLNVLPITMVVLWYLQQRMTPLPADPQQARMMKMMRFFPFIFGFMLYNYAAGLSLYWIASSTLGIFEYRFIRKRLPAGARPIPSGS